MNKIGHFLKMRIFDSSSVGSTATSTVSKGLQKSCPGRLKLFTAALKQSNLFGGVRSSSVQQQFHRNFRRVRIKPNPEEEQIIDKFKAENMNVNNHGGILRPIGFTALVAGTSFVGCTIWQYESYRQMLGPNRWRTSPSQWDLSPNTSLTELRQKIYNWWESVPANERIFYPILAINVLVCMAWRAPSLAGNMLKYFSASPYSRNVSLPMLLSVFSHYSVVHLGVNMFVLHSFMPLATQLLGREQFVAFYLTAGVVSSLGSHIFKIFTRSVSPSLGASGAIMGILGLVCSQLPDIKLGIIFIPGFQFNADTALKCIIAIDSVGMIAGWRMLDHAAHLSGCLFGVAYSHYGIEPVKKARDYIIQKWHVLRTSS